MVHTSPCFTQTHDLHFPRLLQRQQTGPANLDRPSPIEVEVDWLRKHSDRRTGGRDRVGGNRLLVLLSTRGGEEDKRATGEGTSDERPNASETAILSVAMEVRIVLPVSVNALRESKHVTESIRNIARRVGINYSFASSVWFSCAQEVISGGKFPHPFLWNKKMWLTLHMRAVYISSWLLGLQQISMLA